MRKQLLKYGFLTLLGILLFRAASEVAFYQRGQEAIGGEFFFLLLPVLYPLFTDMVHGLRELWKELF